MRERMGEAMRKDAYPLGIVLGVIALVIGIADMAAGLVLGIAFFLFWCIVAMSREHR